MKFEDEREYIMGGKSLAGGNYRWEKSCGEYFFALCCYNLLAKIMFAELCLSSVALCCVEFLK